MTLDLPDLSLITVCRNAEETIRDTINSIVPQRREGVEYLVIDGASTDTTQSIVTEFVSAGVDYFVSEPDNGIAEAFNKGIAVAKGEFVGLINADDQLMADTVQFVRTFFKDHPDVDVLHGDILLYEGERFIKQLIPAGSWWHPWRLVLFNHPATFVRRSVYEELGGYNEDFRIAMDVEIFLRWQRNSVEVQYVARPLAIMRVGGLSGVEAEGGFDEYRRALIMHGYPALVANMQYLFKLILVRMVSLGRKYMPGV